MTEFALAELGYSDTIFFRPGMLAGAERPESRIMESIAGFVPSLSLYMLRYED